MERRGEEESETKGAGKPAAYGRRLYRKGFEVQQLSIHSHRWLLRRASDVHFNDNTVTSIPAFSMNSIYIVHQMGKVGKAVICMYTQLGYRFGPSPIRLNRIGHTTMPI